VLSFQGAGFGFQSSQLSARYSVLVTFKFSTRYSVLFLDYLIRPEQHKALYTLADLLVSNQLVGMSTLIPTWGWHTLQGHPTKNEHSD
jgi:hypothetical protein